jgi:hypothetical protein
MLIRKNTTLKELQAEFRREFPYLKIEFFDRAHSRGEASDLSFQLDVDQTVAQAYPECREGELVLHSDMRVGDFEAEMQEKFNIFVQVYRKSYERWLQTWATDIWTLGEQDYRSRILGARSTNRV